VAGLAMQDAGTSRAQESCRPITVTGKI
jgi:hypothetical protein